MLQKIICFKDKAVKHCHLDPFTNLPKWSSSNYSACLSYDKDLPCNKNCNIEVSLI